MQIPTFNIPFQETISKFTSVPKRMLCYLYFNFCGNYFKNMAQIVMVLIPWAPTLHLKPSSAVRPGLDISSVNFSQGQQKRVEQKLLIYEFFSEWT